MRFSLRTLILELRDVDVYLVKVQGTHPFSAFRSFGLHVPQMMQNIHSSQPFVLCESLSDFETFQGPLPALAKQCGGLGLMQVGTGPIDIPAVMPASVKLSAERAPRLFFPPSNSPS